MKSMTEDLDVPTILERAADLIEPEGAWTQGKFARDKEGNPVLIFSPRATCFCVLGAIITVGRDTRREDVKRALGKVIPNLPGTDGEHPIVLFNDAEGRTQAEVVAKLREAAALARAQASA